ncbi:tetratricopeptide repeat protein [Arthrobacter sp. SX1312]|uniref:AfsR/SARP family transcriptional regulator n=1 Tax=Arthrobacter sp. SX1312 TaxID=2058896 RepID=UPI000CE36C82|nr:tetratricopeptide repeat protein [Arthrobacter sp. SX1312]
MAGIDIQLLGPPSMTRSDGEGPQPRGRKAWGLLAYLLLHDMPTPRSQLAALLFPEADDPLGALRWQLSDLRRVLGARATLGGDPIVLRIPASRVDVLGRLAPTPGSVLSAELLEGYDFRDCPAFDGWLTMERHRFRHAVETAVYDGGLSALANGDTEGAIALATRAVQLDPLNADFHALLVRSLMEAADEPEARRCADRCRDVFAEELGEGMPAEVQRALAAPVVPSSTLPATALTVTSYLEAAKACLSAGAPGTALSHLRVATGLAQRMGDRALQAESLLALAEALTHGAGGRGTEVADLLHRVLSLSRNGDPAVRSAAYRELGFLAVQRGFPASGARWLAKAVAAARALPDQRAKALGVMGMLATDTADYRGAVVVLTESVRLSVGLAAVRQEAFATTMLGRVHLLTGRARRAAVELDTALALVTRDHWTAFSPFVEALRSEAYLARGEDRAAEDLADHATALAGSFGDRCFMDAAAHAKASVLLARGDVAGASTWIDRGVQPHPWYRWFRGRNLDLATTAAMSDDPPRALRFAQELGERSSRYGHRELTVRSYSSRALLGDDGAAATIRVLAQGIDNPALTEHLVRRHQL